METLTSSVRKQSLIKVRIERCCISLEVSLQKEVAAEAVASSVKAVRTAFSNLKQLFLIRMNMSNHIKILPRLTLLRTGSGEANFLTEQSISALSSANVVLYDDHVDPALLKQIPANAKKIYVGKRNGDHTYTQEQVNTLIVDLAFTHGHVVRLKGGDPFVFGSGYEEISHAGLFNIPTEIVVDESIRRHPLFAYLYTENNFLLN